MGREQVEHTVREVLVVDEPLEVVTVVLAGRHQLEAILSLEDCPLHLACRKVQAERREVAVAPISSELAARPNLNRTARLGAVEIHERDGPLDLDGVDAFVDQPFDVGP